jgi:hypothetical protein
MRRLALPLTWNNVWLLAYFYLDREEADRRWDAPHGEEDALSAGEPMDLWAFGFDCGLEVVVSFRRLSRTWQLEANLPELEHALLHLELPSEWVSWRGDRRRSITTRTDSPPESWTVWRQDDYGNRFVVDVLASERTARCLAETYEARAHKQSYWVERSSSSAPAP